MARVEVQRVPQKRTAKREIYATVCYYYPQYSLKQAEKLSARDIKLLLDTATKIEATQMHNLLQISAAPHSKGGKAVQTLSEHFKKLGKQ